jgi:hypothetical protein
MIKLARRTRQARSSRIEYARKDKPARRNRKYIKKIAELIAIPVPGVKVNTRSHSDMLPDLSKALTVRIKPIKSGALIDRINMHDPKDYQPVLCKIR